MIKWHKNLTQEKWNEYPLSKQMLMIGTEFARMLHQKSLESLQKCFERSFELLDLSFNDPKVKAGKRELSALRTLLNDQLNRGLRRDEIEQYYQYCLQFHKLPDSGRQ